MSEHSHNANPAAGPGYETSDVHVAPISKFIVALIALMVTGIVSALGVFWLLNFRQEMDYADMKSTTMQETRQVPPGPLLQVTNHDDLVTFRTQEARDVAGHATWLDKNAKVVRLPIDRAIELVSERGLPVFKGENPATAAAAAASGAPAK